MVGKRLSAAIDHDDSAVATPTTGSSSKRVKLDLTGSRPRHRVSTSDETTENHRSAALGATASDSSEDEDRADLDPPSSDEDEMLRSGKQTRAVDSDADGNEDEDDAPAEELDDEEIERLEDEYRNEREMFVNTATAEKAQHGIVEEVTFVRAQDENADERSLHDFMVHEHFNIKLEPFVNFVCGANGSGKSAVLTALLVGLGSKAATTGRAKGLQGFIRDGASSADIVIRLKNQGDGAWKPNEYGKSIQIKRTINASGASAYKIMSYRGETVSTKATELTAILEHFNIYVDNPIVVLGQDATKEFLSASKPADMYRLFLKGTMLATLQEEYRILHEITRSVSRNLKDIKADLPELKEAKRAAEKALRDAETARNLETRSHECRIMLLWAHVAKREQDLAAAEADVVSWEAKIDRYDKELAVGTAGQETAKAELVTAEAALAAVDQGSEAQAEELRELKKATKAVRDKLNRFKSEQREMNERIQHAKEAKESVQQQIEDVQRKTARAAKDNTANDLRQNKERLQAERIELSNKVFADKAQHDKAKDTTAQREELNQVRGDVERCRQEIQRINAQLAETQSSRNDPLARFGPAVGRLVAQIKAERRWRGDTPLGPLGQYVKVDASLDKRWLPAIETIFDQSLNSYLVFDRRDVKPLSQLLRAHNIIYTLNEPFPIPSFTPDPRYTWMINALQFSDERVGNILINSARIDGAILVEDKTEADELMRNRANVVRSGPSPGNQIFAYTKDFYRIGGNEGGYQRIAMTKWGGMPRLTEDISHHVQDLQRSKTQAEQELRRLLARQQEVDSSLGNLHQTRQRLQTTINVAQRQMAKIDSQIRDIDNVLEDLAREAEIDISALVDERQKCDAEIEDIKQQYAVTETAIRELGAENAPRVRRKEELESESTSAENRRQKAAAEVEKRQANLAKLNALVDKRRQSRQRDLVHLEQAQAKVVTVRGEVELAIETSNEAGPRQQYSTDKTMNQLVEELDQIRELQVKERRRTGKSYDELKRDRDEAYQNYRSVKDVHNSLQIAFNHAYNIRRQKWTNFRSVLARECKYRFQELLSRRGFEGHLIFNHQLNGKLTIRVRGADTIAEDGSASQRMAKTSKTLSGGEKSWTTVCFLVTLWAVFDCPIRALDEFDVFMDPINRRAAVQLLKETAETTNEVQHIFISPNANLFGAAPRTVKVHELAAPERLANTLNNPRYGIQRTNNDDQDDD